MNDDELDNTMVRPPRWVIWAALAAFVALVAGLGAGPSLLGASADRGAAADPVFEPSPFTPGGECAPPERPPSDPLVLEQWYAEAEAYMPSEVAAEVAAGWERIRIQSFLTGAWYCGFVRALGAPPLAGSRGSSLGELARQPVYGAMEPSEPIGYNYGGGRGFVPASMLDDPSFDLAEAMVDEYGCSFDLLTAGDCVAARPDPSS